MTTEKQFKEKWKTELESTIQLSKQAKEDMLDKMTVQSQSAPKRNIAYPFILLAFIAGALFLSFLQADILQLLPNETANTSESSNSVYDKFILGENFYWLIGLIVLEMMTVFLLFAVLKKTKRWEHNAFIIKIRQFLFSKTRSFALQMLLCIGIAVLLIWMAGRSLLAIQSLIAFFALLLNCLVLLWFVRDLERVSCPHCHQQFTRKEISKMTWAPYRLKCFHCRKNLYLSKTSRNKSSLYVFVPMISLYGLGFVGIPIPIIVFCFILVALFFNFYITFFTNRFSEEDEPLW